MSDFEENQQTISQAKVHVSPLYVVVLSALFIFLLLISVYWYINANRTSVTTGAESIEYLNMSEDIDTKLSRGEFEDAADAARRHQTQYPDDPFGYLAEATAYLHQSVRTSQELIYIDLAYDLIQKALAINPQNSDAYRLLAHVHELKMEFDVAFEMYNKAILFSPNDDAAYASRGHLYYITGNDILAEDDYKKALAINSENGKALTNLALLYIRTGQSGVIDVEEILKRAIAVETNDLFLAEAYNALGVLYITDKDYVSAISAYEQAIQYDENMVPAWNGVGMANIYLLQEAVLANDVAAEDYFVNAAEAVTSVLSLDENFARGYLTEGLLYGFSSNPELEKQSYQKGLTVLDMDTTVGATEREVVRETLQNLLKAF